MFTRWEKRCKDKGFGALNRKHGVDVRPVGLRGAGAARLARYLTKVGVGEWGVGHELARPDLKVGQGVTPFEILQGFADTGDVALRDRWMEYEFATFARRKVVWSAGLRARLLGVETELSDEELAASDGAGLALVRALVPADEWRGLIRVSDGLADLLERIEGFSALLIWAADLMGHPLPPIRPRERAPCPTDSAAAAPSVGLATSNGSMALALTSSLR